MNLAEFCVARRERDFCFVTTSGRGASRRDAKGMNNYANDDRG